jgi:hypothetical protein
MSKKKYYNLTVFCEGATPSFFVDEEDLEHFEMSFNNNEGHIEFKDKDNDGSVVLRNQKLAGYKKSIIANDAIPKLKKQKE